MNDDTADSTADTAAGKAVVILETVVGDLMHQNEELIHQNDKLLKENGTLVHECEELVEENKMLVKKQRFEPIFKAFGAFRVVGIGLTWTLRIFGLLS